MTDRIVKTTLIIDDHGSVKVVHGLGDESGKTEHKLGGLDRSVKGLGKSFGGLKGMIGAGLGAIGVGGLAFGLSDIASKTKEIAGETEKFSAISGMGATASLRFGAALKARGIDSEAGGRAFKFFSKSLETATRQQYTYATANQKAAAKGKLATGLLGVQASAYQRLGLNLGKLSQMSEETKFTTVLGRLSALKDGTEKTAIATALFGKGAIALSPILEKGALGWEHQYKMAKKFFPTIKGEGAAAMRELLAKQAESKMAWEGLEFTLGMKLIPVMTTVFGWMSKVAGEVESGRGFWGGLGKDIEGVALAVKGVVGWLAKLGKTFNIPVGVSGLGAALMAFAGIHAAKHPIKAAKTAGKLLKVASEHPEIAPVIAGAAIPFASAYAIRKGVAAMFGKSFLGEKSTGDWTKALFGSGKGLTVRNGELKPARGFPDTKGEGKPATGRETPREARELSRLLEHPNLLTAHTARGLTPNEVEKIAEAFMRAHKPEPQVITGRLEGDSKLTQAIAEALHLDPKARRHLAEATAQYAQGMTARK